MAGILIVLDRCVLEKNNSNCIYNKALKGMWADNNIYGMLFATFIVNNLYDRRRMPRAYSY